VFVVVIGNGGKSELEGCDGSESLVMEECYGVSRVLWSLFWIMKNVLMVMKVRNGVLVAANWFFRWRNAVEVLDDGNGMMKMNYLWRVPGIG